MQIALSQILPLDIPISSSQLTAAFNLIREEYKSSYSSLLLASHHFQNSQPDSQEAEYLKYIILGDLQRYRHSKHSQLARHYYLKALLLQYDAKSLNKLTLIGEPLERLYYQSILLTVLVTKPSAILKQLTHFCTKISNNEGIAYKFGELFLKKADPCIIEAIDLNLENAEFAIIIASSFTFYDASFAGLFTHIFKILAQNLDKTDFASKDIFKLATRLLLALGLAKTIDNDILQFAFDGFQIKKGDRGIKNMLPRDKKYLKYPILENRDDGLFNQADPASKSEFNEIVDWQLGSLKSALLLVCLLI